VFGWIRRWWDASTGKIDATISRWVHDIISGLYTFLATIFFQVGAAWTFYENIIRAFIEEVEAHARHVADNFIAVYRWINHEGWLVFHYISHPSLLVELIWRDIILKLEHEAWNVAEVLGRFFLSLIVRNLKHFVMIVEDIFDAVF
jgi:hypothetical protein